MESISSASTRSVVLEQISNLASASNSNRPYTDVDTSQAVLSEIPITEEKESDPLDLESGPFAAQEKRFGAKGKRFAWILVGAFIVVWGLAAVAFLISKPSKDAPHDPDHPNVGNGRKITMAQIQGGEWAPVRHAMKWIEGAAGEDGLLLEQAMVGKDYLVVEDVRGDTGESKNGTTLIKTSFFEAGGETRYISKVWPSRDLKHVLIATDVHRNWRHSVYAKYFIFNVEKQTAEPLDPDNVEGRIQLASWSPQSDAVVFTRENNMFLRKLAEKKVVQITKDGGPNLFYGVPDWVYEEEVLAKNSATWWAEDGKYIAFFKTDESQVPEYPVQYFFSRPSGKQPKPGLENYPEVRQIKYPKAGAPNPTVSLLFYDVKKAEVFSVNTSDELPDDDRIITEVVWAGNTGKAIVKETNRVSDFLRVVLYDTATRTAKTVRRDKIAEIDGGWYEVTKSSTYIPADPANGRQHDGYIDQIVHDNYNHLAYFHPLDSDKPTMLTTGNWEVVDGPSAVDLNNNIVYFVGTKESPITRNVYSVSLVDPGKGITALTDTTKDGWYDPSFSTGAEYMLLSYNGPSIPWQKVISTPSHKGKYEKTIEENKDLEQKAKDHDLPTNVYSTVEIDGFEFQVVERRPPHFDERKKYPVLFHLYQGPGSQTVKKTFAVDFQAYVAGSLNYIVVTVDGRGTGFIGRKVRSAVRDNLGYWESHDQIETAKIWAAKPYVDKERLAIWGWSYGGFMTLKTLERDAGRTFKYGMAVAPVTDWRFYDSIYTERYMHTPQANPSGYDNATISDVGALGKNVRFLVMHGVADDNVHMQSTLALVDKLDLEGVENYDMAMFPDSDHSIYFHGANKIVYDSKYPLPWMRIS
jgi:dipeptidyl aminopeptidase